MFEPLHIDQTPLFEGQEIFWESSSIPHAAPSLPQFDNSLFKHMQGDENCLMTNQTKKVRAFVPRQFIEDEFEMLVNCTEKLMSNFDEVFPRSLGIGRFNEKGVFSIPFSQQTTSNNKKKGKPYLQFSIQFRGPRVQFQSEWFWTVCQNTRAKKRFRKETKDDTLAPSNFVPEFIQPLPVIAEPVGRRSHVEIKVQPKSPENSDSMPVILKTESGEPAGRLRLIPYWPLNIVRESINRDIEFIDFEFRFYDRQNNICVSLNQESLESLSEFLVRDSAGNMNLYLRKLSPEVPRTPEIPGNSAGNLAGMDYRMMHALFGVVDPAAIPPDKISRFHRTFGSDYQLALQQSARYLEQRVFGNNGIEMWFLGFCTRNEAEGFLNAQAKKTFLLRFSGDNSKIALSIRDENKTVHGVIDISERGTFLYNKGKNSSPLPEYRTLNDFIKTELVGFRPFSGNLPKMFAEEEIVYALNATQIK
eukprot:TRINITY_DN6923_c0_g1_i1.p1 TRINITY_DN6923_c0_g1~~TRINITY_DN6923_c0_g1_i1.p1  ORF type:complete len:475 (+),score=96.10 TRINITY_DN6923_c0_g1_i1:112-1536(+)